MMPSDGQLNMRDDDVKRNVLERKDLTQQVKLFHISKPISLCREGACLSLGGRRQPAHPLRSREAADEPGLTGWSPSLWRVPKLPGFGLLRRNILCFPQKQPSSVPVLPSKELTPVALHPRGCLVGCSTGTGSPIHGLCAFPSNEPKPPLQQGQATNFSLACTNPAPCSVILT